ATLSYEKMKPSDVEFSLPQLNYTTRTLINLWEKFPKNKNTLLMCEHNLNTHNKWKNNYTIHSDDHIVLYYRLTSITIPEELYGHPNIRNVDAPIVEFSSIFIRNNIKERKNIRPMLNKKVWEYIDHNLFYR